MKPEEARVRLLDAVTQYLLAVATPVPTVLVLDDLHWADPGTVTLLRHLARFAARSRLLVLGAYRDVDVDAQHPLTDALGTLPRETSYDRLGLAGLDAAAVHELLETLADHDLARELTGALTRETSGNPFFIRAVLLHLLEERALVREEGRWRIAPPLAELRLPDLAETMEAVYGERAKEYAAEIARHYHRSASLPGGDRGVPFCLEAADKAQAAPASDEVVTHLRAALDLLPAQAPEQPRLLGRLGLALVWALQDEEAQHVACEAMRRIAQAEGAQAAANYAVAVASAMSEAGFVGGNWGVAREGLSYTEGRRDAAWAALMFVHRLSDPRLRRLPNRA